MSKIIDLSGLTFTDAQVLAMRELIVEKTLGENGVLSKIHRFIPNAVGGKKIGLLNTDLGLLFKAAQGCNPTADSNKITATEKAWADHWLGFELQECYTDHQASFELFTLKQGANVGDMTNTEYFDFIMSYLPENIGRELLRAYWFNDTAAEHSDASPAGVITPGTTIGYFTPFDGFFKQLATAIAAYPARRTAIAANSQATYALQKSTFTPALALEAVQALITDASPELVAMPGAKILCTRSVFDGVRRARQAVVLDSAYTRTEMGMESVMIDGYELVSIPLWDKYIMAYEDNGTSYNKPHRAVFVAPDNIPVRFGTNGLIADVKIGYDFKSDLTITRFKDNIDGKLLFENLFQYAV